MPIGKRRIIIRNISGMEIKVRGEVIKDQEQHTLGRFGINDTHKIEIHDKHGKVLIEKVIHLRRRAKHLIFMKGQDGHLTLKKLNNAGEPKEGDVDVDSETDLRDKEDEEDENKDTAAENIEERGKGATPNAAFGSMETGAVGAKMSTTTTGIPPQTYNARE
jgi:hypothetical protein